MNKGQSLYELVVAIGIMALVVIAVVSLAVNSIHNSNYSKNNSQASTYAQEASEWLRGQRDANMITFAANAATSIWCLKSEPPAWDKSGACADNDFISGTSFIRQANFIITSPLGKTLIETDVTVSWTDSKGIHQVKNDTNFSDLRQR